MYLSRLSETACRGTFPSSIAACLVLDAAGFGSFDSLTRDAHNGLDPMCDAARCSMREAVCVLKRGTRMIVCRLAQWARQVHLRPSRDSRVALPTQNAGRRHASCGERAWTSTCPPPVSTMAGRLIDKLGGEASLAEARSGPSCERHSLSIRTRPIACSTSRIQYFELSLHHQCRLSSYPSPTSIARYRSSPQLQQPHPPYFFPQTRRTIPSLPSLYRRRSSYETRD